MAQTTTQDEDLLIISDDTGVESAPIFLDDVLSPSSSSEVNISSQDEGLAPFVETVEIPSISQSSPVNESISFDFSNLTEAAPAPIETPVVQESETSSLFEAPVVENVSPTPSSDIFIGDTLEVSSSPAVSSLEEEVATPVLSIAPIISTITPASSQESGDLNVIISETIEKLEKRKSAIAVEKDGKIAQVQDLRAQIKALEEEVALHEAEIDTLSLESQKITRNITQLEKMKLGDDEVITEHNAKRAVKK